MNIEVLLAGNDGRYIRRLSDVMKRRETKAGDKLNVILFTNGDKLRASLNERKASGKKNKFHIALIDEDVDASVLELVDIPVVLTLTETSDRDGGLYPFVRGLNSVNIYKYQRISAIIDRMVLEFAKKRDFDKKGDALVYAFYSPVGGCGSSTMAASYAVALARSGIKPLYVSFEYFNSTELFFNDSSGASEGLYDVFCVIAADGGGVTSIIDATKNIDKSGVEFLRRFSIWTEVTQIKPADIEKFITAARASHGVGAVILDLGTVYAQFTEKAFECADEVFIVADGHKHSQLKLGMLLNDKTFVAHDHLDKVSLIYNKATSDRVGDSFGAKSVTLVKKMAANNMTDLIEAAANDLKGLVRRG